MPNLDRLRRAKDHAETVYVAEEPHATALRMAAPDLPLYPLPAGLRTLAPPDVLWGVAVAIVHPSTDEARFRATMHAAAFLAAKWEGVKVVELPGATVGEWLMGKNGSTAAELCFHEEMTPRFKPEKPPKITQGDWLVEHARKNATLFHTPDGEEYARFPLVSGAVAVASIRDREFGQWLSRAHLAAHSKPPGKDAVAQARDACSALAALDGPCEPVFTRTARHEGKVYVDLCDDAWRVVEIDATGWRILDRSPVAFRRPRGMQPLPMPRRPDDTGSCAHIGALVPTSGADLNVPAVLGRLRAFVHLADDGHFAMLLAWLVGALSGEGPYPHLSLVGEQDAGKSTATEVIRSIIDPYRPTLLQPLTSGRDLMIAARNRHVVAFDNLSGIPNWFSDALCVLSTGGGYSTRRLHTDNEEELFDLMRPVITNGIDEVATRPDLLSRTLVLRLSSLPKEARKAKRQLDADFRDAHPVLLGALLTCVATALRDFERYAEQLTTDHRMVDFAAWAEACQALFPTAETRFTDALARNRAEASMDAADADPYIRAIRGLIDQRSGRWEGTANALLDALQPYLPDLSRRDALDGIRLSRHLRRHASVLADIGVTFEDRRTKTHRLWTFTAKRA